MVVVVIIVVVAAAAAAVVVVVVVVVVKVKVHALDIAPLRSETPPQKRSGMARVLKGFHTDIFLRGQSARRTVSAVAYVQPRWTLVWYRGIGSEIAVPLSPVHGFRTLCQRLCDV